MKPHEMRELTLDELQRHLDNLTEEFVNLKIKLSVKQLDNPMRVRVLRREIAQAKTVIQSKRMGAKPGDVHAPQAADPARGA